MNKQMIIQKAASLKINTMKRVTADEQSLWVYNINGRALVGYPMCEPVPHLMQPGKVVYEMRNSQDEITDIVQFL